MRRGFTLIEVLVVLIIISTILAFSFFGAAGFRDSLEYKSSVNQILSDVKLTQQLAQTSYQTCRIDFKAGGNTYIIKQGSSVFGTHSAGSKVKFYGKSYFSFAPSGFTDVGGSGTLSIGGASNSRNIIVSSKGRIRLE